MRNLFTLLGLLLALTASAQQNPQYSQYIFNSLAINPAYAGSKNVLNLNVFHRSQWTGIEGAPTTQALSLDGIAANNRLGLGLNVTRDRLGAQSTLSTYGNAAVKLPVSRNGVLSLGMAVGFIQNSINGSELGVFDDPSIPQGTVNIIKPDVKLGMYFHTPRFYAGVSASDLVQYEETEFIEPARHYYFTTGYVFDVNSFLKFKPSVLLKEDFNGPTSIDANAFVLLDDKLWIGGSYRTSMDLMRSGREYQNSFQRTAIALIGELHLHKSLRVGYAYDKMLNDLRGYNTHEVSVGYYFHKKKETRMLTPQYF